MSSGQFGLCLVLISVAALGAVWAYRVYAGTALCHTRAPLLFAIVMYASGVALGLPATEDLLGSGFSIIAYVLSAFLFGLMATIVAAGAWYIAIRAVANVLQRDTTPIP